MRGWKKLKAGKSFLCIVNSLMYVRISESGNLSLEIEGHTTVLVLDKDEKWARKIANWIKKMYSAEVVSSKQAMEKLKEENAMEKEKRQIHLIVADKDAGGIALMDEIVQSGSGVPVILTSSKREREKKKRAVITLITGRVPTQAEQVSEEEEKKKSEGFV